MAKEQKLVITFNQGKVDEYALLAWEAGIPLYVYIKRVLYEHLEEKATKIEELKEKA